MRALLVSDPEGSVADSLRLVRDAHGASYPALDLNRAVRLAMATKGEVFPLRDSTTAAVLVSMFCRVDQALSPIRGVPVSISRIGDATSVKTGETPYSELFTYDVDYRIRFGATRLTPLVSLIYQPLRSGGAIQIVNAIVSGNSENDCVNSKEFDFESPTSVLQRQPIGEASFVALSDDFNGTAIDASKWTATGPVSAVSVANHFAQFKASGRINTQGKVAFSGQKIVIEARMAGQGPSRDTSIAFTDAESGDLVYSGDTSYFSRGFFAVASGAYNIKDAPRATDGSPYNVLTVGTSTPEFRVYRWTLEGDKITIERGLTLDNMLENATRTLGRSIVGRSYYLSIGTAGPSYSPGTWDWVRVTTY